MDRHELDPVSLTAGFAFTGLGLLFLLGQVDQALRLRWVWPLLLAVLGLGILLDLTRNRVPDQPSDPDQEPSSTEADRDRDLAPTDRDPAATPPSAG